MRRGDIVLADLAPVVGSEANKVRPVVVVGHDAHTSTSLERSRGVVTVVPLTSHVARVLSFQTLLPAARTGLDKDGKAQAEQVRSIDVTRLGRVVGRVPDDLLDDLGRALRLHLCL